MTKVPRLMIAGIGSGSGKTTLTCALLKNFSKQGKKVVAFKCGPDYIDPMFHTEVLKTKSYNLDLFMLGEQTCKHLLHTHGLEADLSIIEGVMGFYDGISDTVEASSYDLAYRTKTPVVLVVSCKGMGTSLGALLQGYLNFKPSTIKGVILNGVTAMTYSFYRNIVEKYTPLQVFGYLPYLPECSLESRHLGLITAKETVALEEKLEKLASETKETIDFEGLLTLAQSSLSLESSLFLESGLSLESSLPLESSLSLERKTTLKYLREMEAKGDKCEARVKIGLAQDKAFSFYYADSLNLLEQLGAVLIPFSPMVDEKLPEGIKGLLLGGGYPEVYAKQLANNVSMKTSIFKALEGGMPCIAECGGFMYLQQSIRLLQGETYPMVGFLEGDAFMTNKLNRFGYIELTCEEDNMLFEKGECIKAHEFHYSDSTVNGQAFTARKPLRHKTWQCISAKGTLFAGYPHFHLWSHVKMAEKFILKCEDYKK